MLTRDDILKAQDCQREPLDIPEWGGVYYVREMSAKHLDTIQAMYVELNETEGEQIKAAGNGQMTLSLYTKGSRIKHYIIAASLSDKDGNLYFDPDNPSDIDLLKSKSAAVLERIDDKAREINAISEAEQEDVKKNSSLIHSDDSSSNSAAASAGHSVTSTGA